MKWFRLIQFMIYILLFIFNSRGDDDVNPYKEPTVNIAVLVRNKFHTLPYFLSCIYNLNYPKDRIHIWIYSDYNEDDSDLILQRWVKWHSSEYNGVQLITNKTSGPLHADEESGPEWTPLHFEHMIKLRQKALDYTRRIWADYLFMLDADAFLTNRDALSILVKKKLPVVAPMLISDGLYSNFWCGMSETFYYERTPDYEPLQSRERQGCFQVPMVHSALLISLRREAADYLAYRPAPRYAGPRDDIIVFAITASQNGIPMYICNDEEYGFLPVPLETGQELRADKERLLNVKLTALARHDPLPVRIELERFVSYPTPWKYGCGEIYMINLQRRPARKIIMDITFKELGMDAKVIEAVDGRELDMEDLSLHGVELMPGYEDPYHKRPMKAGEVGCFMSHYYIWQEIADKGHDIALVLEDDVHFVPYFRHRFINLLNEIADLEWDLVYLGRKILLDGSEDYVTPHTTRPLYSYWTLGYLLTAHGARKLLAARPLTKMLPVDEFLPIMFDQHPNETWKSYFSERNLRALSAAPLLLNPTHYTGQPGYISDTEDSLVVTPAPAPAPAHAPARVSRLDL